MLNINAVVVLVVAAVFTMGVAATADQPQFCSRAEASRRCARPPTVDDMFNVEEYLGKWYEIGSTASFKLLTEAGLACNQALYSASPAGNLSLLNSGLQVIGRLAVAEVAAVNVAARGTCAAARQVCHQLADLSHLISANLSSLIPPPHAGNGGDGGLLLQLTTVAQAAHEALQELANDVSLIQQSNGRISQADYSSSAGRSLESSIYDIKQYVKEGGQQQEAVASFASSLNKIRGEVVKEMSGKSQRSKAALENAALSLSSIALKVGASSIAIDVSLKAVGASANALKGNGHTIDDGGVQSVTGSITQPSATSAAKLEVTINGTKAPYWIIGVEKSSDGAYSAALVYSCSQVAGTTAKSLFVLSREAELEKATLNALLAKAESLGIYDDCEDPFLLTVQRGGDCGRPPS